MSHCGAAPFTAVTGAVLRSPEAATLSRRRLPGRGFSSHPPVLLPVISGPVATSVRYREETEDRTVSIISQTFPVQGTESYN